MFLNVAIFISKDILWRNNYRASLDDMPPRKVSPKRPHDACRIHGSLTLNKVSGNFHITAGRSLHLPRGHIHLSVFMSDNDYNFSHRINRFSFGDPSPGIIHPLEGDEMISNNGKSVFIVLWSFNIFTYFRYVFDSIFR